MSHGCFIHSSTDGLLGCFHILVIVNNTALKIEVLMFFWISILSFFRYILKVGQKADPFFWGISILLSTVVAPVCIPTNSKKGSPFSTSSPALVVCWFIADSHSDKCEMISHCGFNLYLSDDQWHWASFHMSIGHLYVLFGQVSFQVLCPYFSCLFGFLVSSFVSSF